MQIVKLRKVCPLQQPEGLRTYESDGTEQGSCSLCNRLLTEHYDTVASVGVRRLSAQEKTDAVASLRNALSMVGNAAEALTAAFESDPLAYAYSVVRSELRMVMGLNADG